MSTPSTKCPKCGAEVMTNEFGVVDYKCDSWANTPKNTFEQSEKCTLRASLAQAVEALRPFADMVPRSHMTVPDETEVTWETEYWNGPSKWAENWPAATVGDLRRASAVLKEISKDL